MGEHVNTANLYTATVARACYTTTTQPLAGGRAERRQGSSREVAGPPASTYLVGWVVVVMNRTAFLTVW